MAADRTAPAAGASAPPPETAAAPAAALEFPVDIPFVKAIGAHPVALADGRSELRITVQPWHTNSWQVAHGGVLMTVLDVAMAQAARTTQQVPEGHALGMATIEMKTSFVRPARGELVATGRVLHLTLTMAFCEASIHDAAGRLCAHATGTFKFNRRPAGRAASHPGASAPDAADPTEPTSP